MSTSGMVIVGAGKAGASAIVALREHGWSGAITLIGEELHAPYDRPPLSKSAITGELEPEPTFILDVALLNSLGVTFVAGTAAVSVDRMDKIVVLADGRRIPFHRLLIATGARARALPLPSAEHVRTLRDFSESKSLRAELTPGRRVAIIGGGYIGLELAASANARGCMSTVIEVQPRVLMRGVPATIASRVAERHALAGVSIITGATVNRIEREAIVLRDGRNISADIMIAGVGSVPETSLAQTAGLTLDNGIACDTQMRTSDPHIFAAGDCCSFTHPLYDNRRIRLEAWRSAQDQGAVAAQNMLGANRTYEAVPWFWSDQYELTLQIAGLPTDGLQMVTRQLRDGAFIDFQLDPNGRLVCASGIGPGNFIARDIRLAQMLIAKRAVPDPAALADAATGLKSLMAA
jgi:3-phenylpropionate/trans-cinnamate dioxygenase ferredoxin reductase subunit